FTSQEAHALLVAHHLLANLEPGTLSEYLEPLRLRIRALLGTNYPIEQVERRSHIVPIASRPVEAKHFEILSTGVLQRRRLQLIVENRARGEISERIVSPQRLVHYRDNWYLDAWCHSRDALRTFALDRIRSPTLLDTVAMEVSDED